MPLPNRPSADRGSRVLDATLARVRERRRGRRRVLSMTASFVVVAATLVWSNRPSPSPTATGDRRALYPPASAPDAPDRLPKRGIEPVPAPPGRLISRSSRAPAVERVPSTNSNPVQIVSLSDEQLLDSLPPGRPAALVRNPDGTARLLLIP